MARTFWAPLLITTAAFAASASAHEPVVVPAGEGRSVAVPFHETRLLLSETGSEGGASIYEFVVPPRSGGAPPHEHTHEDEYAYVLDGTLTLLLGDRTVEAGPGTLAALTRGTVHAFWNASDEQVRTLFFVSRGGFEHFFDAVAVSLREQPPATAEEANARVGAIAAEHGIAIRPELIPESVRDLYEPG
ncbi:MAG: cupin domain-containing protein [Pseudomonadales bacterium]